MQRTSGSAVWSHRADVVQQGRGPLQDPGYNTRGANRLCRSRLLLLLLTCCAVCLCLCAACCAVCLCVCVQAAVSLVADQGFTDINICYSSPRGDDLDTRLLRAMVIKGILEEITTARVNLVNADLLAKNRGLRISEVTVTSNGRCAGRGSMSWWRAGLSW